MTQIVPTVTFAWSATRLGINYLVAQERTILMQLIRPRIQHGKHRAGTRRGSPFGPPLMVHASELTQTLDWSNAHTINHADCLSDSYIYRHMHRQGES